MAEFKSDGELLRDYVDCRSEKAFADLVERHTNLVFATASRGVTDLIAAQEVTQNVFIAPARKAAGLRRENTVTGWLHKTTLLEVRLWWRGEMRRRKREQTAIELGTTMKGLRYGTDQNTNRGRVRRSCGHSADLSMEAQ